LVVLFVVLAGIGTAMAVDWPQFRGPSRDGTSPETGLMKQWPDAGPVELWSCGGLGVGYSSVAVVDGVAYTCGMVGGQGYLFAIDSQGKVKYKANYGPEWDKAGNSPGTRTTPTVDGQRLYLMSGQGRIACYNAADGMLYGYGENGKVGLIRIKPDGYDLVSSFQVKKGSGEHWAHPAISDSRLYIRHGDVLMCYDIKAE
jgi:hypothetical protein